MARKIYERTKMQNLRDVFTNLFTDLKEAGLTQILPASGSSLPTVTAGSGKFIFDSHAGCNPMNETQKWRLLVELDGATGANGRIKVAIATPQQISTTGEVSKFPGPATDTTGARVIGQLGSAWSKATGGAIGDAFVTRNMSNVVYDEGTLTSSLLVVTNRGVFFSCWVEGEELNPVFSMFNVQVPVDKDTGAPLLEDKSPIFCVFNCDNTGFMKYVVSEADVGRPSRPVTAEKNTKNSNGIINAAEQVSIARGNKYLITMPNRLNTERFAYSQELDMFGYVSADVIGEGSEVSVTLYDEEVPRVYRALKATGGDNSLVRLVVLVENGGVPTA